MSNQPYMFSRVTAHDVISLISIEALFHISLLCCSCMHLLSQTEHIFIGNRHRRELEPNNLLRYRSQLAVYMTQEPNTVPYSSGPSLALHDNPDNFFLKPCISQNEKPYVRSLEIVRPAWMLASLWK